MTPFVNRLRIGGMVVLLAQLCGAAFPQEQEQQDLGSDLSFPKPAKPGQAREARAQRPQNRGQRTARETSRNSEGIAVRDTGSTAAM